jgi:hypothetical protein
MYTICGPSETADQMAQLCATSHVSTKRLASQDSNCQVAMALVSGP